MTLYKDTLYVTENDAIDPDGHIGTPADWRTCLSPYAIVDMEEVLERSLREAAPEDLNIHTPLDKSQRFLTLVEELRSAADK